MTKTTEAQIRATKKFQKKNIQQVLLKFHKTIDADIIRKLDDVPSKQGYIKDLIRKDLMREEGRYTPEDSEPEYIDGEYVELYDDDEEDE